MAVSENVQRFEEFQKLRDWVDKYAVYDGKQAWNKESVGAAAERLRNTQCGSRDLCKGIEGCPCYEEIYKALNAAFENGRGWERNYEEQRRAYHSRYATDASRWLRDNANKVAIDPRKKFFSDR